MTTNEIETRNYAPTLRMHWFLPSRPTVRAGLHPVAFRQIYVSPQTFDELLHFAVKRFGILMVPRLRPWLTTPEVDVPVSGGYVFPHHVDVPAACCDERPLTTSRITQSNDTSTG